MNARIALHEMLPWLAALLAAAIVGGVLVMLIKRYFFAPDDDEPRALFDELRELRDRGEITPDEYETARLKMVARLTGKDFEKLHADAVRKAGGLVAEPGRDLLGRPLPTPPPAEGGPSSAPEDGPAQTQSDNP